RQHGPVIIERFDICAINPQANLYRRTFDSVFPPMGLIHRLFDDLRRWREVIAEQLLRRLDLSGSDFTAPSKTEIGVGFPQCDRIRGTVALVLPLHDWPRTPRVASLLTLFAQRSGRLLDCKMILLVTAEMVGAIGRLIHLRRDGRLGHRRGAFVWSV